MVEKEGFGDDADGVVGDDDGTGDEIARTFWADGDSIGAHGIQVRFDPLTGGAGVLWPAKEEAEQAEMFREMFVEKKRLVGVLPAGAEMRFHTDERGGIGNGVFAKTDSAGSEQGELFDESGFIRLRLNGDPFPFIERGNRIKFDAAIRKINTGSAWLGRV